MKIICLFAQRKGRYEGEHAPELMAAIDEYGNEENPNYLNNEENRVKTYSDIDFYKRIEIKVSDEEFNKAFFSENQVNGTVEAIK